VITHGWSGLGLAYLAVQAPMLAAMIRARASLPRLLLSPALAAPVTLVAGAGLALLAPVSAGMALAVGGAVSVGLGYAVGRIIGPARQRSWQHQRGARVFEAGELARQREHEPGQSGASRAAGLSLAGVPLSPGDETKHFKLIGTTGTGKSTAIRELLGGALRRGDRAVIADPDGGYLRRYYDAARGDVVLNPFDQRSVKWDLFGEIQHPYDVEQLARSLLPDHESADRSWQGYARTFLTAVARQAHSAGVRDLGELYRLLVIAPTSELRALTAGTPAQPFLEEHNGRMFDSIRSVASSAVGSLEYIAQQQGAPFSIRSWVRRGEAGAGAGVLFIPYRADQIAALRSTVSAWMRIAIFEAMAGPERDQRLWFVVDELDALGPIDGLKDALARIRKFGGRCVLGFQSVAQVAHTYGAGEAHTIIENCSNTLILRCSASEGGGTSRFASTLIGQREVLRTTQSRTRRATELLGAVSHSEQFSIEPAVMDSEIEQLPDLAGYLKVASREHWLRVALPLEPASPPRDRAPAYVAATMPAAAARAAAAPAGAASEIDPKPPAKTRRRATPARTAARTAARTTAVARSPSRPEAEQAL
jgi:type IV secretion system coupling TraD/TrwB family protein